MALYEGDRGKRQGVDIQQFEVVTGLNKYTL